MKKVYCKGCEKETEHDDLGLDMGRKRYMCRKCDKYNEE